MRHADRTWNVPAWKRAREYAEQHGMQAAYQLYGTTGWMDEDMKIINSLPEVEFKPVTLPPRTIRVNLEIPKAEPVAKEPVVSVRPKFLEEMFK